jgi:hypothetical protein
VTDDWDDPDLSLCSIVCPECWAPETTDGEVGVYDCHCRDRAASDDADAERWARRDDVDRFG